MTKDSSPSLSFEAPALFGWEATPAAGEAVSFGLPQAPQETAARWSLDLPADPGEAAAALACREQMLAASQSALDELPGRLDLLARRARFGREVSFAIPVGEAVSTPDADLLRSLGEVELRTGAASFGLFDRAGETWDAAGQQFQQLAEKLQQSLLHQAWVETRVEGQRLGWTVVNWLGDTSTAWEQDAPPGQLALHNRSLALALQSRGALLRAVLIALQGAVKLSVLLSTPGGQLLALPAAWKYVNQVLAEVSQYRELSEQVSSQ